MKPKCVNCGTSDYVELTTYGVDIVGVIGSVLGYRTIFVKGAMLGAKMGASIGSYLTPVVGTVVGGVAGGLGGALGGYLTGVKIGEKIDKHLIRVYKCIKCGKYIRV
jgi:uncharacterized membrane protein